MKQLAKSRGNMYDWVTHMHTHLTGKCSHECSYCYVQTSAANRINGTYSGPVQLDADSLNVNYGKGKVIFLEHMNDLFAEGVPVNYIKAVLDHAREYPCNQYVIQTKATLRADFLLKLSSAQRLQLPLNTIFGTTMETNRFIPEVMKYAPEPASRAMGMCNMKRHHPDIELFVTIEPIMVFDLDVLASHIVDLRPDFVNIGADSKDHGLPEPTRAEVMELVKVLTDAGITIRKKVNLERLVAE